MELKWLFSQNKMTYLEIKLKREQALRMKRHLEKEHPITKGKMKITNGNSVERINLRKIL